MFKQLLRALFSTFIISVVVSTAVTTVYYAVTQKTNDYFHVVQLITSGIFLLNCILFIMSLPVLFLSTPDVWNKVFFRFLLYFSGAIAFLITALFLNLQPKEKVVYLLTGVIFLVTHIVFYYKMIKKQRTGN